MATYSYPLEFYDVEYGTSLENTAGFPVTVGGNFTPGDLRVQVFFAESTADSGYTLTGFTYSPPSGWTQQGTFLTGVNNTSPGNKSMCLSTIYRTLVTGDADTQTIIAPSVGSTIGTFFYVAFTVRNHNPTLGLANKGSVAGYNVSSVTLPSMNTGLTAPVGTVLFIGFAIGFGTQLPSGFTGIVDSGNAGANYSATVNQDSVQLAGFSVVAGTNTAPVVNAGTLTDLAGMTLFIPANPNVSTALTQATAEVDTANAVTAANLSLVTSFLAQATPEVDLAFPVFTPLYGDSLSQPILLPGLPVTASKVSWSATTYAAGSNVFVHTSIDNGATFQRCTNGGAIPNLLPGNTTAKTVLTKVIAVRAVVTDPTPQVQWLKVDLSLDSYTDELVSQGVFLIDEADITVTGGTTGGSGGSSGGGDGVTGTGGGNTGGGLSIDITGTDLSLGVQRNPWNDVFFIPYGTNVGDAVQLIIDNRFPGLTYNLASTVETTPQLVLGTAQGNDPWQDAMDIAAAIGYEIFFDANGVFTFRPVPDPTKGTPVWEFNDGMKPTVVSVQRTLNDQTTYNYVVVTGVSTSNSVPVSAVAYIDDPNNPLSIHGPYGVKSYPFQSAAITTQEQAQAAADALILLVSGACDTTVLTNVPMGALEPGDIVSVNVAEAKAFGNYLLNAITTPFSGAEAQQSTVYRQSTS
jgi:hypothetical protein